MDAVIIDRGRGPEIAGTRITVYDIFDHLEGNISPQEVALIFRLSQEQVGAAIAYIEEHKEDVEAVHRKIVARNARGNPPELLAKLEVGKRKLKEALDRVRTSSTQEDNSARNGAGQ
ncbi:MAG TPA: DUF433 domain-containing protein [Gemmataceae bacterium]|nr:DUF433 domain-containing protein [Gemmataceae bacterium]